MFKEGGDSLVTCSSSTGINTSVVISEQPTFANAFKGVFNESLASSLWFRACASRRVFRVCVLRMLHGYLEGVEENFRANNQRDG